MNASVDYIKASDGSGNASLMTITQVRTAPATTITVNTVGGAPAKFFATMGTPHTFNDPVTGETITIISEATAVDFAGHISSGKVEIDAIAPGQTDLGSKVGDIIIIRPTTQWADNLGDVVKHDTLNPVGMVVPYAGLAAPEDWLLCDGASYLRADYADLFTVIGTTYGSVDSTHFNVPDLRGRVVAGQDDMGGTSANRLTGQSGGVDGDVLGQAGGAEVHTLTTGQMPSHTHGTRGGIDKREGTAGFTTISIDATNTGAQGGGGAHNNVQPTIILNYIIKV